MADIIRAEVLNEAQILHDSGDIAGAYSVLGVAGDVYADKAWSITNDSPLSIFDGVVALSWGLGALGLAETKFDDVAAAHPFPRRATDNKT